MTNTFTTIPELKDWIRSRESLWVVDRDGVAVEVMVMDDVVDYPYHIGVIEAATRNDVVCRSYMLYLDVGNPRLFETEQEAIENHVLNRLMR